MALLLASERATILTMEVDRERLLNQYRGRRRLFARLGFGGKLPLTEIYQDEVRLAKWSSKWDTFCIELQRQRRGITLLTLDSGASGFCVQSTSSQSRGRSIRRSLRRGRVAAAKTLIRQAFRLSAIKVYEPVEIGGRRVRHNRETDSRWDAIADVLKEYRALSVLDVGCAEGWLVRRAATDLGCFAVGVGIRQGTHRRAIQAT